MGIDESKAYPGAQAGIAYAACSLTRSVAPTALRGSAPKDDDEEYEIALSSEYEVERSFFGTSWREVLDHSPKSIQLGRFESGRAPFLADHDSRNVIGILSEPRIGEDRILRVKVRFSHSARAQEIKRDIDDGIRPSTSIGYVPKRVKLVESDEKKGELWRVLLWEPLEGSSVAIPADPMVGVGRNAEGHVYLPVEVEIPNMGVRSMDEKQKEPINTVDPPLKSGPHFDHAEIVRVCERNGCTHMAADFIEKQSDMAEVYKAILEYRKTRGPAIVSDPLKAVPGRDRSRYSYARAIERAAAARDGSGKFDGVESEVSQELERQKPPGYNAHGGIFIPTDLRSAEQAWNDQIMKRTLASNAGTKGSELVFETPGELIELLRNRSAIISLGAQTLSGVSGPIGFPKQTAAMTMYWVPENPGTDVPDSDLGLGMVTLSPKTLQGSTAYSRQLLVQASIDVETMVRNELAFGHALAVDRAGIHGAGTGSEPTGIYIAPDVQTMPMGGQPTYIKLVDMIGQVADKNATMGSLGWLTSPLMAAKFLTLPESTGAGNPQNWIWRGTLEVNGTGSMAGYRAIASNQISGSMSGVSPIGGAEKGIIFGNWGDIVVGLFNSMELIVDPYSKKKRGLIEVTSFQMADVIIRHGESFSKTTGATLT